jgi:hypothetical protein
VQRLPPGCRQRGCDRKRRGRRDDQPEPAGHAPRPQSAALLLSR